ncbi:MAG: immunoglobulin domain-containing protein, partial [Verrucomicrobia bacterium]|nr:immunoglobulin domain-containing protein [Verrucomicrobiota bacterium]
IAAATNISLTLSNVQFTQAGNYAVWVTNAYGSCLSSNALLTVNPPPPCVPPPSGLVGWWRGESNAWDQLGVNPGMLRNGAGFGAGAVGQAFNLNGTSQYVEVPNSASLNPTGSISVEAWIYPRVPLNSTAPIIKKAGEGTATQDGYRLEFYGTSGVRFGVYLNGGRQWVQTATAPIYLNQWSHYVGVFNGTNLSLYVNGALAGSPVAAPGQIVPSGNNLQIGHDPSITTRYFNGLIDEASVYNTALSAAQVQAIYLAGMSGKCPVATPPSILVQPANQMAILGSNVIFSVTSAGTPPLSYQWSWAGSALDGATNASLTLTNVQFSQAGNYSVVITNAGGSASSSNATLSVNFPPAVVRVASVTNATSGATVIVPVVLAANGNEIGLSFSLNFDPAKLTFVSLALGSGASGANLLTNAAQAAGGKLGVILSLPTDTTFPAGTQEVIQVTFMTALLTNDVSAAVSFGDDPIVRQLSDASGKVLAATYTGGVVTIQAADFEGDLAPPPNGDKAIQLTDWVMAGRYAARLDYPTNAAEFQRADCAPRATLGDGKITVSDWVQVGRYAAGWDPLTAAGGPGIEIPGGNVIAKDGGQGTPKGDPPTPRLLEVADTMLIQGMTGSVPVKLEAQGNENAVGFSLS